MKFKVIKLPYYLSFDWCAWSHNLTEKENILDYFVNQKDEWENPLYYITEAENVNFPKRENIGYCVRIESRGENKYNTYKNNYEIYSWQLGKWWKTKNYTDLFTDLYVPKLSWEDFKRFPKDMCYIVDKKYQIDFVYYCRLEQYKMAERSARRMMKNIK